MRDNCSQCCNTAQLKFMWGELNRLSHWQCDGAGAACAGITHYAGTTRALKEEGVESAARLKAVPTAVRPLSLQ